MGLPLDVVMRLLSPKRPAALRMAPQFIENVPQLRGGAQPASQLLTQLSKQPGVKQGALRQVFADVDPAARMTPQELRAKAKVPKLFAQRGASSPSIDPLDEAIDLVETPEFIPSRARALQSALREMADPEPANDSVVQALLHSAEVAERPEQRRAMWANATRRLQDALGDDNYFNLYMEAMHEHGAIDDALRAVESRNKRSWGPAYGEYQRQGLGQPGQYFETVMRLSPEDAASRGLAKPGFNEMAASNYAFHFGNPAQLGHARGAVLPESPLHGHTMVVDELQSDLEEAVNHGATDVAIPELDRVYGKLGRMLLDRSAEAGVDAVLFPSAKRIASVRGPQSPLKFYEQIYDKQLPKELFEPLSASGVPVRMQDGWTRVELPPEVRRAIRESSGILNYKRGGLAQMRSMRAQS